MTNPVGWQLRCFALLMAKMCVLKAGGKAMLRTESANAGWPWMGSSYTGA